METIMKNVTIILDAGHGKLTPGKRSPKLDNGSQFFEWEFTRKLSNAIKKSLDDLNIRCIQSNVDESDPGLSARATNINQIVRQNSELGYQSLMISLHGNAAGEGNWNSATGWEIWTTEGTTNSDKFAKIMCDTFKEVFPDQKLRGHKEKNFTILYKTACPCVLTENFFYDCKKDLNLITSSEGFQKLVDLHVESIKKYIS